MQHYVMANAHMQVEISCVQPSGCRPGGWVILHVALRRGSEWVSLLAGLEEVEFRTSLGCSPATTCQVRTLASGESEALLTGQGDGWAAQEILTLAADQPVLHRKQTVTFTRAAEAAIQPGFRLRDTPGLRYTYPLRTHEKPLAGLPPMRAAVDWALPFPFHVWHDDAMVAIYGLDKRTSPGTLDYVPVNARGWAGLGVYWPDIAPQPTAMGAPGFGTPLAPELTHVEAGDQITLTEIVAVHVLAVAEEPLLEAARLAAKHLLSVPAPVGDIDAVASAIARFFQHCDLWEPDALGPGRGWFSNMWVHTQTGTARKRGEMSGYYDLGWGEGIAVEMMLGAVRHWKRTGDPALLPYVNEMTRNMELFKRAPGDDQPYFDRSDGTRFGDFLMDHLPGRRLWTHSLGHNGSQLLQMVEAVPDYPDPATRREWLAVASSIARFLARHQAPDGDLQDIFDDSDAEGNTKPHRVTARVVVCGLWVRLARITGDTAWTERAMRLAHCVAPSLERYEYLNQMLDGISGSVEFMDGEAAYYALEGLVPLAAVTRDPVILSLCRKAAAFGVAWTYFYDVPKAHNGVSRGGQCCRMPDFPLLYPIGPAKAMTPLLELHALTGDAFFLHLADEAAAFISQWQLNTPGKPWDGGMIHALGQYCGKHWGPDLAGQVDTGMATGNSLAALEAWLAERALRSANLDKEP